jgi:hypothetical protein
MMGRLKIDQGQLFYEFHLGDAVPEDHLVRKIDAALDLSWLRSELAPHYSSMGRPSIDPELMIRMLVVGYVFAIRSERLICREVQVNLATAGSASSVSRTLSRIIRHFRAPATSASAMACQSRSEIQVRASHRPLLSACSRLSTPRNRAVWGLDYQSAGRLSKRITDDCGRALTCHVAPAFNSPCRRSQTPREADIRKR